jgi:hypothetical protein
MKTIYSIFIAGALLSVPALAQAPPSDAESQQNLKVLVDMVRKDLRQQKQAFVDEAMGLEAGDKAKFWGVYAGYQKELSALWDKRFAGIKMYAESYDKMDDASADKLANSALGNQAEFVALVKKYYPQMKTALGGRAAARFLQVELILNHLTGVQVMSQLPIIP